MSTKPDPARERLAHLMNERRRELGRRRRKNLTWDEVAVRAGIHRETLRLIRNGESDMRDTTKDVVEDALEWRAGSIDAVLGGGEPTPVDAAQVKEFPAGDRLDQLYQEWRDDPERRDQLRSLLEADMEERRSDEDPQDRLERLWREYRDDPGPEGTTLRTLLETWGDREPG